MLRTTTKIFMALSIIGMMLVFNGCTQTGEKNDKADEPLYGQRLSVEQLKEWQNLKYGMFIHFGMSTFVGEELPDGKAPIETYNPTDLDVSQWVKVAKDAGMRYMVLTSKHVAGHCLWPSEYTEYDVTNSPDTTDVVGEFVKECRKQGIEPGIYY